MATVIYTTRRFGRVLQVLSDNTVLYAWCGGNAPASEKHASLVLKEMQEKTAKAQA